MGIIDKISPSGFLKNVLTLISGTTLAQLIPLLIAPVLSRLYTPGDFGILGLYISIVAVVGVISTGRYELAIVLPQKDRDAVNILGLASLLVILVSLLSLFAILLFGRPISRFFDEPGIRPYLYLIPVSVAFIGFYQIFNYWSTRKKTFRRNAAARISQTSSTAAVNTGLGFAGAGSAGLIVGTVIGQAAGALALASGFLRKSGVYRRQINRSEMKANGKKYINFLRINTPHAFIDSLQANSLIYVIMAFFSKFIVGSYSFAFRIIKAPVGLVGNAIYQVLYQEASVALQQGREIRPMILKIYKALFLTGLPVFTILFLFTPEIFSFVFGEEWRTSGEIARILIPYLFINFLASPVSCIPLLMNRQKEAILFAIADIILKVGSILIGGFEDNYRLGFIIMSISCSLLLVYALFWYYKIANPKKKGYH